MGLAPEVYTVQYTRQRQSALPVAVHGPAPNRLPASAVYCLGVDVFEHYPLDFWCHYLDFPPPNFTATVVGPQLCW